MCMHLKNAECLTIISWYFCKLFVLSFDYSDAGSFNFRVNILYLFLNGSLTQFIYVIIPLVRVVIDILRMIILHPDGAIRLLKLLEDENGFNLSLFCY